MSTNTTIHHQTSISTSSSSSSFQSTIGGVPIATLFTYFSLPDLAHAISTCHTWYIVLTHEERELLPQLHQWNQFVSTWERETSDSLTWKPYITEEDRHHLPDHHPWNRIDDRWRDAYRTCYMLPSLQPQQKHHIWNHIDRGIITDTMFTKDAIRQVNVTSISTSTSTPSSTNRDEHQHDTDDTDADTESLNFGINKCAHDDETHINVVSTATSTTTSIEKEIHQHETNAYASENEYESDDAIETTTKSSNQSNRIPMHEYVHSPHIHPIWISSLPQVQYPSSIHEYNASHHIYGMYKTKNQCDQIYLLLLPRCSDRSIPVGCGRFYRIDEYFHNEEQAADHYSGIWFRSPDNHLIRLIYETKFVTGITYSYWISDCEPESYVYPYEKEMEFFEFQHETLSIIHSPQHQHQQQYKCTGPILLTHSDQLLQRYHSSESIPISSHNPYEMIHSHIYNHPINDLHMLNGNMTSTHPFIECIDLLNPSIIERQHNVEVCVCDPHVGEDEEMKQRRKQREQRRRYRYRQMR